MLFMRKVEFANGHLYPIYNRGVEKRDIFLDESDYQRFLTGLTEFNTPSPVNIALIKHSKIGTLIKKSPDFLVKIHAFCLMPNHYHLLLEQVRDNGISDFMQKLGIGYVMYRNVKYGRVGPLFQGRFKAKLIEEEIYLTHLLRYIHLNPVELIEPKWKEKGINDWKKVLKFLDSYKWSSKHDYNGKQTYPNIVSTEFLLELLGGPKGHREFINEWLLKDLAEISSLLIEE